MNNLAKAAVCVSAGVASGFGLYAFGEVAGPKQLDPVAVKMCYDSLGSETVEAIEAPKACNDDLHAVFLDYNPDTLKRVVYSQSVFMEKVGEKQRDLENRDLALKAIGAAAGILVAGGVWFKFSGDHHNDETEV